MPVVFLPHGGGPWPFVELEVFDPLEIAALGDYLRSLPRQIGVRPEALLVVSAHWEEDVPTVMTASRPSLFYDYFGFPPESYEITWPAPGSPELAARVQELLSVAGFETEADAERGFDHGTFIPLKLTYPNADVPTVQLSLMDDLDPGRHIAMGEALAPLREEGVLIVGSGMSFHDLRALMTRGGRAVSESFDGWLRDAATAAPGERKRRLREWTSAPDAHRAHPRAEHLLPLMVVVGAAGDDRGDVGFRGTFGNAAISAFHYGSPLVPRRAS